MIVLVYKATFVPKLYPIDINGLSEHGLSAWAFARKEARQEAQTATASRFILNAIDNHSHLGFYCYMYVCICNAITDKQIRKAAESGVEDLWGLQRELGVAAGCGSCKEMASEILLESRQAKARFEPVLYQPAAA